MVKRAIKNKDQIRGVKKVKGKVKYKKVNILLERIGAYKGQ